MAIARGVEAIYQPFYDGVEASIIEFAQRFSIEDWNAEFPDMPLEALGGGSDQHRLFVVSLWETMLLFYANTNYSDLGVVFCLSVGIGELMRISRARQHLDVEDVTVLFKIISDSTRYQIMVEMSKPHVKSKDLAEKLGITRAAISFHTQKLVNASLLLYNTTDKDIKFDVNKGLLRQVIACLDCDFQLEEDRD